MPALAGQPEDSLASLLLVMVMNRIRHILAFVLVSLALPATARAQSGLNGQLTILEKNNARTTDLSNAVVWLESATPGALVPAVNAQIVMESRQFVPRLQVVPVGSTVAYPNHDPFRHNVFSKSGPAEFDLGLYARGERKQVMVQRAGVYPIFCNIHAKMVAYVVATSSRWTVRPGADGRFSIDHVPTGTYTLKVWHERGGELSRSVQIAADSAAPIAVQLDARRYKLMPHRNKFGKAYTATGSERY